MHFLKERQGLNIYHSHTEAGECVLFCYSRTFLGRVANWGVKFGVTLRFIFHSH